ncbi:response regulator [Aestuariibius insulae]|uniref:TackOD1 domain-containing metal-binding protein n=1 Tax=Aestuariibius insulae TaxID=2058287 RepID=UPI00398E7BF4
MPRTQPEAGRLVQTSSYLAVEDPGLPLQARRVLLVEDSSVTTDLVTLVLTQAGHSVTCAADGTAALAALRANEFDVVLTDFHLPDINGTEVVRRFRDASLGAEMPVFIAITGDVRGLLNDAHNCEIFDKVVPKPLDIDAVCELVEFPPQRMSNPSPVNAENIKAVDAADLPFSWFHWPPRAPNAIDSGISDADAILVTRATDLDALWEIPGANLLPIADQSGTLGVSADVDLTSPGPEEIQKLGEVIEAFHLRRDDIDIDLRESSDEAERLLGRMHVTGGALTPKRDGRRASMMAWNSLVPDRMLDSLLTQLEADSLVERAFFERVHCCPVCDSARLIAREECPSCQSAQLSEESYIHHFRCAHQAPESEFIEGDELICPKCRRRLTHFGQDYDRPGQMVVCKSCQTATSEPSVSFACADCDKIFATDRAVVLDVSSARLTDRGLSMLRMGRSGLSRGRTMFRFSDLPIDMIVGLNRAANLWNEDHTPFVLARISHANLFELRDTEGLRQVSEARRLWLSFLRMALDQKYICSAGRNDDYVLLTNMTSVSAETLLGEACISAARDIRLQLDSEIKVFGPDDLAK